MKEAFVITQGAEADLTGCQLIISVRCQDCGERITDAREATSSCPTAKPERTCLFASFASGATKFEIGMKTARPDGLGSTSFTESSAIPSVFVNGIPARSGKALPG